MWQALYEELSDKGFVVIAVSFDTRAPDASRPFIEAARPTHPSLLDPDHHVADLYNMVNIPNAVWIDEDGRIVRPAESAGTGDEFRAMVRPGGIPADDRLRMVTRRARTSTQSVIGSNTGPRAGSCGNPMTPYTADASTPPTTLKRSRTSASGRGSHGRGDTTSRSPSSGSQYS